jgi:RND superfamily putative drug exporter
MERELTGPPDLKREPWTVRVAVWSARHRWPVLAGWFVLTIGLMLACVALGGQRSQSIMDKGKTIGDSQTAWNVFNDAGPKTAVTTESFYLIVESNSGQLDTKVNRAAVADMTAQLQKLTTTYNGVQTPVFYADPKSQLPPVVDPFQLVALAPDQAATVMSADGTTAIITAKISGDNEEATTKADVIKPLAAQFKKDYPGLTVYAFNNRLINEDFGNYINSSLDGLLLPTLLITFLILLVASRSAVAAFVPIVLALSAIIGAMGMVGLYSQVVSPVSQYVAQIVVLIGLAVAVDYSLFVISRFRTERSGGRDKFGAIEVASSTAGRAVFFSGMAVMISLGGLLLIDDEVFKSIAIGSIAVVLISVFGSLTFLPASLSILDRKVTRLGIPFLSRDRGEGRGVWGTIVRLATNRAVVAATAAAAILIQNRRAVRCHRHGGFKQRHLGAPAATTH